MCVCVTCSSQKAASQLRGGAKTGRTRRKKQGAPLVVAAPCSQKKATRTMLIVGIPDLKRHSRLSTYETGPFGLPPHSAVFPLFFFFAIFFYSYSSKLRSKVDLREQRKMNYRLLWGGKAHRPTPLWRSRSGKHIGGRAGNSRIGKTRAAYMP